MFSFTLHRLLLLFFLLGTAFDSCLASVLAIDYGSDWIKASLMKPGVPFDVLLNKDSKRKIQSSVAFKNGDRLFGTDAYNLATRFPSDSFSSIKYLQGAQAGSEPATFFTSISTADIFNTARYTVGLKQSDGTEWSAEELIAMQFAYVKHLAEVVAEEQVQDVIVTVPAYYSQFERDAVADAIEIAGLRTLALIHDGTAVAVNYAMTRSFATPEYHVIYDAGASSIRATVVSFASLQDLKSKSPATQITAMGVGFDRKIGGTELDRRLRDILADAFVNKHKRDIRSDKRGMARLWKEAGRLKAILSANTEAVATVESLAFDIDFKAKVTRAQLENAASDLQARYALPIWEALRNSGLSLDNITSVILTGGSSRTPMIQAAVKAAVGEEKIALNVNADEAAVLGAALHGASLSRQFKTKDIRISDLNPYSIQASYFSASTSSSSRSINTLLFPSGSKLGTKKTLSFKRQDDFSIWLDYKTNIAPGFPTDILEAQITGVKEAIDTLIERGAIEPVVKAVVSLSESGFVSVKEAFAYGELKDDSIAGKLKSLFGGGSSSDTDSTVPEPSPTPDSKEKQPTPKDLSTIPLNITISLSSVPPMSVPEKKAARDRLKALDYQEMSKQRREEARNDLEGYLYRVRDLLDDGSDTPFKKCSKSAERKAISDKLSDTITWLHDEGDEAETTQLWAKRSAIEMMEKPIIHRYQEIEAFPQALNNSQMWNWSTRLFLTEARDNVTAEAKAGVPSKWTLEELGQLEKTLKEHEVWLHEGVEKQKTVKMYDDPVISTSEMRSKAKKLEQHLQRLVKRKAPKVKKTSSAKVEDGESTDGNPPGHDEL